MSIGDKQNITDKITADESGKQTIEFEGFRSILKLIVFWKMVRLENQKTPNNVGHWAMIRNMRRKILFGSDENKSDVDLMRMDKELA